jgi:transposase-like protein
VEREIDWDQIKIEYLARIKSVRQIALEHGITHGAINKRRKRDGGWGPGSIGPVSKPVSKTVSKPVSTQKPVSKPVSTPIEEPRKRPPAVPLLGSEGFQPEFCEIAYKFCLLGATNERLAEMFGVSVRTVYNWQEKYPEFLEALRSGREVADATVAKSLYHRANGYSHMDTKAQLVTDKDGNNSWETLDIVKHYPPDTKAAIHWLSLRQGEKWREKQDVSHTVGGTIIHVVSAVPNPKPLPEGFAKPKLIKAGGDDAK